LKREEFEARKMAAENARLAKERNAGKVKLASAGRDLSSFPLLKALADREELVRSGKLSTIIFIRDRNRRNQEVSGYIDYAHRLKTEDWGPYFDRKKKLMPRPSDLSFYNWDSLTTTSNGTPNFQVICDQGAAGILFKSKRDRKIISVAPESDPGDTSHRVVIKTPEFLQVVLWDHVTRRR
jgi:hypothetical protein